MAAPPGVQIQQARRFILVIQPLHGLGVGGVMLHGAGQIGLGLEAAQVPMGGQPGAFVAVPVVIRLPGRVDEFVTQVRALHAVLQRRGQVAEIIGVVNGEAALIVEQAGHPGVHKNGQMLIVPQVDAADLAQQAADGDAVGGEHDGLAVVLLRDLTQGGVGPLRHLGIGLRPGEGERGLLKDELAEIFPILPAQVAEVPGLPGAQADLTEAAVRGDGQIMVFGDGGSGEAGPVQVAGIDRVHMYVLKTFRQRVPLQNPHRGDAAVPVALTHTVQVALRLDVADYINFCHNYASNFLTIRSRYSIIHWIICQLRTK